MINVTIASSDFRFSYIIADKLKNRAGINIIRQLNNQPIPYKTDIVITTNEEKDNIMHESIFIPISFNRMYLISNIELLYKKRDCFKKVIVGIDPGKTIGFVTLADEILLHSSDVYSINELMKKIVEGFLNIKTEKFIIKIGSGSEKVRDKILSELQKAFHSKIDVFIVDETSSTKSQSKELKERFRTNNIRAAYLIAQNHEL